jgi:hypothetical protein
VLRNQRSSAPESAFKCSGISVQVAPEYALLDAGLVDELHLLVDPIAVRYGMRLFENGEVTLPLALISSTTFSNGVLHLVYGPVETAPKGTYRAASKAMEKASSPS